MQKENLNYSTRILELPHEELSSHMRILTSITPRNIQYNLNIINYCKRDYKRFFFINSLIDVGQFFCCILYNASSIRVFICPSFFFSRCPTNKRSPHICCTDRNKSSKRIFPELVVACFTRTVHFMVMRILVKQQPLKHIYIPYILKISDFYELN